MLNDDLNPVFQRLVENSGWVVIKVTGGTLTRSELIEKSGVVLDYFSEVGGSDQTFCASSAALLRAENGVTVVPSFRQTLSDLKLKFTNSDIDFETIDQNLNAVRDYLGDRDRLLDRLKFKANRLRTFQKEGAGLARRLPTLSAQMSDVDETYRRAAREQLPQYEKAIESLSRKSK